MGPAAIRSLLDETQRVRRQAVRFHRALEDAVENDEVFVDRPIGETPIDEPVAIGLEQLRRHVRDLLGAAPLIRSIMCR